VRTRRGRRRPVRETFLSWLATPPDLRREAFTRPSSSGHLAFFWGSSGLGTFAAWW
jgi:hypothetical protein